MSWRSRPTLTRAFVVVWLLIQISIPLQRVTSDAPPERFVWRMFSTAEAVPEYTVTAPNSVISIDLKEITARLRADLPFDEFVPVHLCATIPDAVTVQTPSGVVACPDP